MSNDYTIRLEKETDYKAVENLTREAFWNVYRPGCYEHYVVNQFRDKENYVPELAFVMEKDGEIIGHIMYVRSELQTKDGQMLPMMSFGPISIAPAHQGQGYGTALLEYSMEQARAAGAGALAITGDMGFYGRFGFEPGYRKGVLYAEDPTAFYFLVKELEPGYLDNVMGFYADPEGYDVSDEEVEEFDKNFPPKEKVRHRNQLV